MKRTIILTLLLSMFLIATVHAQTVAYYHTDALGTPVAVTDAGGNVVERSEYEPYGSLLNRPLTDGPGYTGHVMDAATGLTYMQQRYYDTQLGRLLSVDPVTAYSNPVGAFNRYWYANNNPYRFTDPDGRQAHGPNGSWNDPDNSGERFSSPSLLEKIQTVSDPGPDVTVAQSLWAVADMAITFSPIGMEASVAKPGGAQEITGAIKAVRSAVSESSRVGYKSVDGKVYTYSKHGLNRAIGDGGKRAGTSIRAIRDALQNPKSITSGVSSDGRPFAIYKGKNARVIVNPKSEQIISVNPVNRGGVR